MPESAPAPRSMPGGAAPFTAADAAYAFALLARRFDATFRDFAARHTSGGTARRLALDAAARVLGEHAQVIGALVPESVLLAEQRAAGAAAPVAVPAEPAAALAALDAAVAALVARAAPVADGAFVRAAAHARADLATLAAALSDASG